MRPLIAAAFGLLLLGASLAAASAEAPPKLIFKKQVRLDREENIFTYTVRKGEYVYSILRSYDVPSGRLPLVAQDLKRLNPHIDDLDRIEPGTRLNLPSSIRPGQENGPPAPAPKEEPQAEADPQQDLPSVKRLPYTVAKGDHLAKILREELQLPDRLIFDEFITLFKEFNPDIENVNALEVGQRVVLPAPADRAGPPGGTRAHGVALKTSRGQAKEAAAAGNATQALEAPEQAADAEPSLSPVSDKALAMTMLRKIGLRFAPGKEMLYPFPEQGWLQINLEQMPLAYTPWGDSILFVPEEVRPKIENRDFQDADLELCVVPTSWDLEGTFRSLEETSKRRILFWGGGRSLILNQGHGVLEMVADFLLVKRTEAGKQYFPFHLAKSAGDPPSQLLLAYLAQNNVRLYERSGRRGDRPTFLEHDYPSVDSVYVPTLERGRAWEELRASLQGSDLPEPSAPDFSSVFQAFKRHGRAEEETLRFDLFNQPGCRITLRMPVYSLQGSDTEALVMSRRQANPYLVALLSLRGHTCFALSSGQASP